MFYSSTIITYSFLTCYVVDRVKSNTKSSHFKRILSFSTPCNLLDTIPVFCGEDGIIIDIQRCSCKKKQKNKKNNIIFQVYFKIPYLFLLFILFPAYCQELYWTCEETIDQHIRITLILSHIMWPQWIHSILRLVIHELDLSGPSILCILNQLLHDRHIIQSLT